MFNNQPLKIFFRTYKQNKGKSYGAMKIPSFGKGGLGRILY